MDRNDSNPGMIERQLDDAPMQGSPVEREEMERGAYPDRDHLQRGGSVEREGLQGEGMERDSMRGDGMEREGMQGEGMERESLEGGSPSEREGGYGMDRPASGGTTTARDW
jgi:pentapeptide MXKDX repeat protein